MSENIAHYWITMEKKGKRRANKSLALKGVKLDIRDGQYTSF